MTQSGPVVVVESKLRPPTPHPNALARQLLVDRLEDAAPGTLRVVIAAPGWGKSQLVAQWLARHQRPVAYVSLDEADNDPVRFWRHLLSAVGRTGVDVDDLVRALSAPGLPFQTEVVEPLALRLEGHEVTVVLEDFHVITSADVTEAVEALVDARPEDVEVAVITRTDPPLHLPRRRMEASVVEIRAADLALAVDDAALLLDEVLGGHLPGDAVARLVAATEGWPAGLYLAALSMQTAADPAAYVDGFAGDDRMVGDYLSSEVLARLAPDDRDFLVRTAVLDELRPDVCDALLGRNDSVAMIDRLVRTNLFVLPIDDHGRRYRYHHLFRDWLRMELDRVAPGARRALHAAASTIFDGEGDVGAAIDHALAAGDFDLAHRLLERAATAYIDSGAVGTVARWLSAMPDGGDPGRARHVALLRGWVGIIDGDLDAAHRQCGVADQLGASSPPTVDIGLGLAGEVEIIRAYACVLQGRLAAAATATAAARDGGVSLRTEVTLAWVESSLGYWTGQPDVAALEAVSARSRALGDPYAEVLAESFLAHHALDVLDDAAAHRHIEAAFTVVADSGIESYAQVSVGHLARARARLAGGDASAAHTDVLRAVDLAVRRSDQPVESFARLVQAQIEHSLGLDDAGATLAEANRLIGSLEDPGILAERAHVVARQLRLAPSAPRAPRLAAPVEPLTDREMALLRLLPGTLSQRELASALHVSFNTVKTYNRQIYRKLGVASRDDAVAAARGMGLL